MKDKIRAAETKRLRAVAELQAAIKEVYPIGSEVDVRLGNADVWGRVMGYGCSWSEPEIVIIVNIRTGKRRQFSATSKNAP